MEKDTLLSGIKVLDVGVFGVGPFSCSFLGRLGADVTRIEPPGLDNTFYVMPQQQGASTIYIAIQSNKRNIILDLYTRERSTPIPWPYEAKGIGKEPDFTK